MRVESMRKIALLGGTGSVGLQTIDIIEQLPAYELYAFAFNQQVDKALPVIEKLKPPVVITGTTEAKEALEMKMTYSAEVLVGIDSICDVVKRDEVDIVVNALLGSIGLRPTIEAIRSKKQIAFANKETLVTAGHLV